MDNLIWFIIIIIGVSVFERMMKAAQRRQQQQRPPAEEGEWETPPEPRAEQRPLTLQDLIAEQLGLNMERRPQVRVPPELPGAGEPDAAAGRRGGQRVASRPVGVEPEPERGPQGSEENVIVAARGRREAAARERRAAIAQRRGEVARRRAEVRRPVGRQPQPRTPLEERAPREREHLPERYGVPEAVAARAELHERYVDAGRGPTRRRPGAMLPDRREWSAAQKAIIWAEVLGPPKGL